MENTHQKSPHADPPRPSTQPQRVRQSGSQASLRTRHSVPTTCPLRNKERQTASSLRPSARHMGGAAWKICRCTLVWFGQTSSLEITMEERRTCCRRSWRRWGIGEETWPKLCSPLLFALCHRGMGVARGQWRTPSKPRTKARNQSLASF